MVRAAARTVGGGGVDNDQIGVATQRLPVLGAGGDLDGLRAAQGIGAKAVTQKFAAPTAWAAK